MLAETGEDPAVLRAQVTSPAGHHRGRSEGPGGTGGPFGLHGGGGGGTERVAPPAALTERRRTIFFLSDYGTQDEFVGVVHAVLLGGSRASRSST